ncbi:MAG TPA: V-type ATP synthase subunit F [Methanomicrobiales archaeon]|nr:V-type ATP synthase subunit F [Methanomicrobiales archaeon]
MEIAVIGSGEFVLGFRLAGIRRTYAAEGEERLKAAIQQVMEDPEVGILVLNTADFERIPVRLRTTLENSIRPTVVAIGSGEGGISLREKIKRSVGVDLWK